MSQVTSLFALKARYLFPVDAPPVADGIVSVAGERIVAVGENTSGRSPIELGNVAILPGLINAHTHLEFSDLSAPIGRPRMPFTDWIAAVIGRRRDRESASADIAEERAAAVEQGLVTSVRSGSTTLAEIATSGWPERAVRSSAIDTTVFWELIGLSVDGIEPLISQTRSHIATSVNAGWHAAISPHAPYTVHPLLLQRAAQVSSEARIPVAMHLAESKEELELLRSGTGPFVRLLERLDAWHPSAIPRGTQTLDYLQLLSSSHRALIVHGNYLDRTEIEFLAAHSERLSVVFCPRTHAYFDHEEYPLAEMLSAGVNVALGTDSLASNPDLSILEEMRYLYRHSGAVSARDILRLGTANGAKSLGLDREIGGLAAGKRADLAVVQLPDMDSDDPHELLLGESGPVVRTYCRGQAYDVESADRSEPSG